MIISAVKRFTFLRVP